MTHLQQCLHVSKEASKGHGRFQSSVCRGSLLTCSKQQGSSLTRLQQQDSALTPLASISAYFQGGFKLTWSLWGQPLPMGSLLTCLQRQGSCFTRLQLQGFCFQGSACACVQRFASVPTSQSPAFEPPEPYTNKATASVDSQQARPSPAHTKFHTLAHAHSLAHADSLAYADT